EGVGPDAEEKVDAALGAFIGNELEGVEVFLLLVGGDGLAISVNGADIVVGNVNQEGVGEISVGIGEVSGEIIGEAEGEVEAVEPFASERVEVFWPEGAVVEPGFVIEF